ncbi:Fanconi anemia group A protein isoform X2 [Simochromis diagramma]|uniref:Fanconi anemia group A protein isoform X2 n=1 Tax=Simochromis diagramma TaxID=43689 RepID=UPI001A7EC88C|nr:Fanconi anemia group A protein isoform X2 [Simochromis diagramma]
MSLSATCESVSQKRTLSSLLAGRELKRPKLTDAQRLQEAAIQLLEQQQNICSLFREVGRSETCNLSSHQDGEKNQVASEGLSSTITGSLLASELRRQAVQLGVPVAVLSVKTVLERLKEITEETSEREEEEEETRREMLTSSQRVQLCVLLESSRELLSQGAICPKLLWQEYMRDQRLPKLEMVYYLHSYNILNLKYILESDEEVRSWLVSQLRLLCGWRPPQEEEETKQLQQKVLSSVVGVLVGAGFELRRDPAAADRRLSLLCCSILDDLLFWVLDIVDESLTLESAEAGAELWIQIFDASLCGVSVSADCLQRFFKHSLTQTLTYKPRLKVSDAITLQNEWTFAKASRLLTSLFRQLAVVFSVEQLLRHLQQVLETHEVNWKHVLCFLSTLLVYYHCAQPSLKELLSRLLNSAFEGYDLENLITAFLLARQGGLEGPSIFPSYSDWFKMSFGGGSSYHASSKKSLVFLLKFLSDLVPFEPPQYLKVHILHPPYVPVKHRSLLMEYVSLAKTRLADLKESVEDMGLYEDVSAAGTSVQPQCQAAQDVDKAVSLFESTGRISATVMEASIFRRPYFLTRFLPALLTPRVLPVKVDARMSFIEALKKADKIPAAQYSSYMESCQKQRQQNMNATCSDGNDDPLEVLKIQLEEFAELVVDGNDGDMSAQLSRISHTLSVIFPGRPDDPIGQKVISLHTDAPPSSELHVKVVNMILRNFCQCLLNSSKSNPPNRQSPWASRFVSALLGNTQLLSSLIHRLWDLLHNQWLSLNAAHILGLAAFLVHLYSLVSRGPLVQLVPPIRLEPVPAEEALSLALSCSTHANMLFCARLCVAAVCYGICREDSLPQQQDCIPHSLYKKLLYLIPRLLPEARGTVADAGLSEQLEEKQTGLWSSITDSNNTWRKTAWHLWRNAAFQQLGQIPQYQLLFSEWLANELRVLRSEDALPDAERQEYQQWACMELYLIRPEKQGGCGGDMKNLCSHLLNAIMDQQLSWQSLEAQQHRVPGRGTCLPDILSRLQELVYEMDMMERSGSRGSRAGVGDFLFEVLFQRCSSTVTSQSISTDVSLQRLLHTWNRVLLALPAVLLIKVNTDGEGTTLSCNRLIEHINQHQRKACSPAGVLSCKITAHFLRGLLGASVRCGQPRYEVNKAWSQISVQCPVLLISTVHWWQRLRPVLLSLWRRLCDEQTLPEQLQLVTECQHWACSLEKGQLLQMPPAAALLLAASLHRVWRGCEANKLSFKAALNFLRPDRDSKYRQVLVFLLFLCVNDHLTTLLYPQERSYEEGRALCTELLAVLMDSPDWLLIFKSSEQSIYQSVTMVTSDDFTKLMPWAFCSLLLLQSAELLQRAVRCPGFLHTAIVCYLSMLQLFLEGDTQSPDTESSKKQLVAEPSHILGRTKQFLLRAISQTPLTLLSSGQLRQLESLSAELDPELAAALSVQLEPSSPEMDFL